VFSSLRSLVLTFGVFLASCGASTQTPSDPLGDGPRRPPPPKPGTSITHSKLCSCRVCPQRSCCEGKTATSEEEESEYGIKVSSCAGQCIRRVWRVKLTQSCKESPVECCPDA
jgi:hypothetical protein